jgi:tetratricopeptide (TPR) repeat protein
MMLAMRSKFAGLFLPHLLLGAFGLSSQQPKPSEEATPALSPIASLDLAPDKVSHLAQAVDQRDYISAEKLLLDELQTDSHSARAARLLAYIGSIYFQNHDYLNAAIAWKKADALAPLDPRLQFSLAMAYVQINHPDWARALLTKLAAQNPADALYPYWIGRLEYDAQDYTEAIDHFHQAAALAPEMMRAYDNLGLCYFFINKNSEAMENFQKAIHLDSKLEHPSAWPYLNSAITLQFLNRLPEAQANLREAIRIDPHLAAAHYQLGSVLEDAGSLDAAVTELLEAARLDGSFAKPHVTLARIYSKLGRKDDAKLEAEKYRRLHAESATTGLKPAPVQP